MSLTPRSVAVDAVGTLYGETFEVIRYEDGYVGLYGPNPGGTYVDLVLTPDQARQLRKALKKALRP